MIEDVTHIGRMPFSRAVLSVLLSLESSPEESIVVTDLN